MKCLVYKKKGKAMWEEENDHEAGGRVGTPPCTCCLDRVIHGGEPPLRSPYPSCHQTPPSINPNSLLGHYVKNSNPPCFISFSLSLSPTPLPPPLPPGESPWYVKGERGWWMTTCLHDELRWGGGCTQRPKLSLLHLEQSAPLTRRVLSSLGEHT